MNRWMDKWAHDEEIIPILCWTNGWTDKWAYDEEVIPLYTPAYADDTNMKHLSTNNFCALEIIHMIQFYITTIYFCY